MHPDPVYQYCILILCPDPEWESWRGVLEQYWSNTVSIKIFYFACYFVLKHRFKQTYSFHIYISQYESLKSRPKSKMQKWHVLHMAYISIWHHYDAILYTDTGKIATWVIFYSTVKTYSMHVNTPKKYIVSEFYSVSGYSIGIQDQDTVQDVSEHYLTLEQCKPYWKTLQ